MSSERGVPWRLFWLLLVASLLGVCAVLPYALALFSKMVVNNRLAVSLPILLLLQLAQSLVLFGVVVGVGLLLGRKTGITAPILEASLYGEKIPWARGAFRTPILIGLGVGALLAIVATKVFLPRIPEWPLLSVGMLPIWKRLLACFYGGINEELLTRLFLLSLFLWLLGKIFRGQRGIAFWFANALVALLFGAGHLPAAATIMKITPLVLTAVLSLNGAAGLVFGYLCWKRGLEAAMLAHFSADFVLQVIAPMMS